MIESNTVDLSILDWTRQNKYGIGENRPYEQKLVEYGEEMPPPDGGDQVCTSYNS
jgi:hypothetical protein